MPASAAARAAPALVSASARVVADEAARLREPEPHLRLLVRLQPALVEAGRERDVEDTVGQHPLVLRSGAALRGRIRLRRLRQRVPERAVDARRGMALVVRALDR